MQRLPPELVDEILHHAEYWPVIHGSCDSHFQVSSASRNFDSSYCCLITPPIPTARGLVRTRLQTTDHPRFDDVGVDMRRKIKRVTFRFTSRDQGWGGDSGLREPYAGSWTWFDAEIWRPRQNVEHSSLEVGSSISSTTQIKPMMESPTDEMLSAAGYTRVKPPPTADVLSENAWLIQRNLRASSTIQRHTVIWSDEDGIGYDCQEHTSLDDIDPSNIPSSLSTSLLRSSSERVESEGVTNPKIPDRYGCGNGLEFINSLQPGDRIAVIARAKYPGWCNRILGDMSVDIKYNV